MVLLFPSSSSNWKRTTLPSVAALSISFTRRASSATQPTSVMIRSGRGNSSGHVRRCTLGGERGKREKVWTVTVGLGVPGLGYLLESQPKYHERISSGGGKDTLHIKLGLVLIHFERIVRWVIILELEIMYFTLIASQECDSLGIRTPPECGIRFKHFFFVYPVGDAVEDGMASVCCHSYMWRGGRGGRGDGGEVIVRDDIDVVLADKRQRMADRRPRAFCDSWWARPGDDGKRE